MQQVGWGKALAAIVGCTLVTTTLSLPVVIPLLNSAITRLSDRTQSGAVVWVVMIIIALGLAVVGILGSFTASWVLYARRRYRAVVYVAFAQLIPITLLILLALLINIFYGSR